MANPEIKRPPYYMMTTEEVAAIAMLAIPEITKEEAIRRADKKYDASIRGFLGAMITKGQLTVDMIEIDADGVMFISEEAIRNNPKLSIIQEYKLSNNSKLRQAAEKKLQEKIAAQTDTYLSKMTAYFQKNTSPTPHQPIQRAMTLEEQLAKYDRERGPILQTISPIPVSLPSEAL